MSNHVVNFRAGFTVRDGFNLAWGVIAFIGLFYIAAALVQLLLPGSFDDSDAPPIRSGLSIKTDNLSGCQYLMSFTGSLTPRIGKNGKQICAKPSPSNLEDAG